jgi:hypothetical protein
VPNPGVALGDLSNGSLGQNIQHGNSNYIYVRLQNRGPQIGDATVRVYLCATTAFATPASWTLVGTATAAAIAPGTAQVVGPITLQSVQIPAPGHFCLVAVSTSSLDPAPDTNFITSVSMFIDYVGGTNNIAWRNLDVEKVSPGASGHFDVIIRSLGADRERYAVRIDDTSFVPGAKLVVRGPANVLENAASRGMKLAGRDDRDVIYDVRTGRDPRGNSDSLDIGLHDTVLPALTGQRSRRRGFPSGLKVVFASAWRRLTRQPKPISMAGPVSPTTVDLTRPRAVGAVRPIRGSFGFDSLTVGEEFVLRIDYELPDKPLPEIDHLGQGLANLLVVRQYWRGQPLGAASIQLEQLKR